MNTHLQNTHQSTGGGTAEEAAYLTSTRAHWFGPFLSLLAAVTLPAVTSPGVQTPFPSQSVQVTAIPPRRCGAYFSYKVGRVGGG